MSLTTENTFGTVTINGTDVKKTNPKNQLNY